MKNKADDLAHFIYKITRDFPKEELYGIISQLRRAAISIVLNYVEGYARMKPAVQLNFFEISYGSLKETLYLLNFSLEEGYLTEENFKVGYKLADEIGAMLWSEMTALKKHL